jgi:hypothetical protein
MIGHIVITLNPDSESDCDCDSSETYNEYSGIPDDVSDSLCRVGSECLGYVMLTEPCYLPFRSLMVFLSSSQVSGL